MIGMAKEMNGQVCVYNEKGSFMWQHSGTLQGFTSTTVSIKQGSYVSVYDEKGNFQFQK